MISSVILMRWQSASNYRHNGLISWRLPLVPAPLPGGPVAWVGGRRPTTGYVPCAGLTAGPPTLVTGPACLAGGNTISYYIITKCQPDAADPSQVRWCG